MEPHISIGRAEDGRTSLDRQPPQTRLQKKRSNAGVRAESQLQVPTSIGGSSRDSTGTGEGNKGARKGSLRNVVRRMFGRRSREADLQPQPQPSQISPPRHGYHKSEPTGLTSHPRIPERPVEEDDVVQRVLSAPLSVMPPPAFNRTRSPYAVEFPRSARLKPLT